MRKSKAARLAETFAGLVLDLHIHPALLDKALVAELKKRRSLKPYKK